MAKAIYRGSASLTTDGLQILKAHLAKRNFEITEQTRKLRSDLAKRLWARRKRSQASIRKKADRLLEEIREQKAGEITRGYNEGLLTAKSECAALAIKIAEEILQAKVKDSTFLTKRIESQIETLLSTHALTIIVNTKSSKELIEKLRERYPSAKIKTSPFLSVGNAIVSTLNGEIELSWEQHLDSIRQSIMEAFNCA